MISDATSPVLAFMYCLLAAIWSLTGFDAAANLCEETKDALVAARWVFLTSVGASSVCGGLFAVVLCICLRVRFMHLLRSRLPGGLLPDCPSLL